MKPLSPSTPPGVTRNGGPAPWRKRTARSTHHAWAWFRGPAPLPAVPHGRPARRLAAAWAVLLLLAVVMSVWAAGEDAWSVDIDVGRWVQARDWGGQTLIDFGRATGSSGIAVAVILLVGGALALAGRPRTALVAVGFGAGLVLEWALKEGVGRPRLAPSFLEQRVSFDSASFPSGHVMGSVIAAAVVWGAWDAWPGRRFAAGARAVWVIAVIWTTVVAALQPWVAVNGGVHWPSDVVGGLVWALVVVLPGLALMRRSLRTDRTAPLSPARRAPPAPPPS